jgi:hypothetical protein
VITGSIISFDRAEAGGHEFTSSGFYLFMINKAGQPIQDWLPARDDLNFAGGAVLSRPLPSG